ncbi:hypothetical protein ThrDRAFT_00438 [Frankia casuarinae]|nr:hypothetical protein ThrDRAFT_00438 [Frankia casuarinae]KDA44692.1 hypothetical protein BMG523Draft_00542 [Frankia sp. BMG5.23]
MSVIDGFAVPVVFGKMRAVRRAHQSICQT